MTSGTRAPERESSAEIVSLRLAFVARRGQVLDLGMVALHSRGQHGSGGPIHTSVDWQPIASNASIAPIACLTF